MVSLSSGRRWISWRRTISGECSFTNSLNSRILALMPLQFHAKTDIKPILCHQGPVEGSWIRLEKNTKRRSTAVLVLTMLALMFRSLVIISSKFWIPSSCLISWGKPEISPNWIVLELTLLVSMGLGSRYRRWIAGRDNCCGRHVCRERMRERWHQGFRSGGCNEGRRRGFRLRELRATFVRGWLLATAIAAGGSLYFTCSLRTNFRVVKLGALNTPSPHEAIMRVVVEIAGSCDTAEFYWGACSARLKFLYRKGLLIHVYF